MAIAAWPQQPQYAYLIGRLARRSASHEHAERWLRYAMRLSRRRMAWETYALALAGFANLKRQRGNFPAAVRYHQLSLKVARRHSLRSAEGDALYDLAVIAIDRGDVTTAMAFGREAIQAFGPGHSRIYRLAHDFAWLLMNEHGDFYHAAFMFRALRPLVWDPPSRLLLTANLCRAAAGVGWEAIFEETWVDSWVLLRTSPSQEHHSAACLQLAYAAGTAGSWERCRMAAEVALRVATERREGMEVVKAEDVLRAIDTQETDPGTLSDVFPDFRWFAVSDPPKSTFDAAERFVEDLSLALRGRRDE
jgi:hypothetical protein